MKEKRLEYSGPVATQGGQSEGQTLSGRDRFAVRSTVQVSNHNQRSRSYDGFPQGHKKVVRVQQGHRTGGGKKEAMICKHNKGRNGLQCYTIWNEDGPRSSGNKAMTNHLEQHRGFQASSKRKMTPSVPAIDKPTRGWKICRSGERRCSN